MALAQKDSLRNTRVVGYSHGLDGPTLDYGRLKFISQVGPQDTTRRPYPICTLSDSPENYCSHLSVRRWYASSW